MSVLIRRKITVTVPRLQSQHSQCPPYDADVKNDLADEAKIVELEDKRTNLESDIDKIAASLGILVESQRAWNTLITDMDPTEREIENKIMDQFLAGDASFVELMDQAQDKMDNLDKIRKKIGKNLQRLQAKVEAAAALAASTKPPPQPAGSTPAATPHGLVKLPEIEMQKYNGDLLSWTSWWEFYDNTVHSDTSIGERQKFTYLVAGLEGPAKKSIEGIHMTEVNYNMAIDILRERFGKIEPIRQALYKELRNIPRPAYNASSLRNFEQEIEKLCRQLEKMGEDLDNEETLFRLQDKLPQQLTKEMIKEKKAAKEWNTTRFREKLNDIVELQEEIERTTSPEKTTQRIASPAWPAHKTAPQARQGQKPNAARGGTSAIFTATTSNDKQHKDNPKRQSQPYCVFCQAAGHWSTECRKYATVEVRFEQAKRLNLCYMCMNSGHMRADCRTTRPCFFCKAKDHHSTLCKKQKEAQTSSNAGAERQSAQNKNQPNRKKNKGKKGAQRVFAAAVGADDDAQDENGDEDEPWMHVGAIKVAQLAADGERNAALLLTSKAEVFNTDQPNFKARRTVFFDCGSILSFIKKDLAEKLKLKTLGEEVLNISTITTKKPKPTPCTKHEVAVARNDGTYATITVYALKKIIGEIPTVNVRPSEANPDKPWKIQVTSAPDVDLLIGADKFWDFDIRPADTLSNGMKIVESSVGYMAAGRLPPEMVKAVSDAKVGALILDDDDVPCVIQADADDMPSKKKVEEFIALDSLGITDDPVVSDDDLAAQQYAQSTVFNGERYETAYPKNTPNPEIPDNLPLCKKRINAFWHKYRKYPSVLQQVANRFQEQEEQKVIERPIAVTGKHVHHLPFQIVLTPHKNTTKMRIVYDASARIRGHKSLNDNLFRGPVMLPDLCGMVLTLRTGEIVVVGDIEKAFLQISVRPEDRDLARFLWLKDITKPPTDDNIIVYRFTRVVFGIISSPFLLSATIKTHLLRDGSELAKEIMNSIYSDNVLILAANEQEAIQKSLAAREIFKGAAMNLREFKSNSTTVNRALGASDEPLSAFLGVSWDTATDCFVLKADVKPSADRLTKRAILKQMASVFDPQGLLAPALLPAKLVFQETWRLNQEWNQLVGNEVESLWKNATSDWTHVIIEVPRYVVKKHADLELHAFADASKKACGVAVYIRCALGARVEVNTLFGKSRLVPVKIDPSMPRRELISALLGVRALNFIAKHLRVNLTAKHLWSDSKVTISWALSDTTDMPVFLRNRVQEIQQSRDIEIGYVSTHENPADLASRGCSMSELKDSRLWWHGPKWLAKPNEQWPHQTERIREKRQFFTEEEYVGKDAVIVQAAVVEHDAQLVIDPKDFSSYNRLAQATIMVHRVAARWRRCLQRPLGQEANRLKYFKENKEEPFSASEFLVARHCLLRQEQRVHPPSQREIHEWSLIRIDDDLYVCSDRMKRSQLETSTKFPVFLNRNSRLHFFAC